MINSVNFIDGLDGLLAGVATIAAATLGVIALLSVPTQPAVALMCALLAGSLLGFLPWNFHPARVFIGTAGVFIVGYALAVLSVLGTAKVAVALLVLGVPIIDTFWIIIRRLAQGRSPFSADRGHFHHRLLDLGLTHRERRPADLCHRRGTGGPELRPVGPRPVVGLRDHRHRWWPACST